MKLTVGTAYFVSHSAAKSYFGSDAAIKLEEGSIFVGRPPINKNQELLIDKEEGRYLIRDK